MSVRSAALVVFAASLAAAPALARPAPKHVAAKHVAAKLPASHGIDPARVLAGGQSHGFTDRTAHLTSIMGPDGSSVVRMQIPLRPAHPQGMRREADATASLR